MPSRSVAAHSARHWLLTVIAFIAMAAQVVVAIAPLTEGRDGRYASHIETDGTHLHFAHNDATCAACQARSIHGTAAREPARLVASGGHAFITLWIANSAEPAIRFSQDNPRAPPV